MADENDGAFIIIDRHDQGFAAVDVKMVGRLVEDENMRGMESGQHEEQARLLAARKDRAFGISQRRAETGGANLGAAL